ncbi:hypothetical protein ACLOJK_007739 [Asimina triloba]
MSRESSTGLCLEKGIEEAENHTAHLKTQSRHPSNGESFLCGNLMLQHTALYGGPETFDAWMTF